MHYTTGIYGVGTWIWAVPLGVGLLLRRMLVALLGFLLLMADALQLHLM